MFNKSFEKVANFKYLVTTLKKIKTAYKEKLKTEQILGILPAFRSSILFISLLLSKIIRTETHKAKSFACSL
jgi:hypothetical protein